MTEKAFSAAVDQAWAGGTGAWTSSAGGHWLEHPLVQRRLYSKVSGRPDRDIYGWLLDRMDALGIVRPVASALTLGSGDGRLERGLARKNFARLHLGLDLSAGAVEAARAAALADGLSHVSYAVSDLNAPQLPESAFDVVLGVSSVHHVERLEELLAAVERALVPGGLLFLNEFVGPKRFQWPARQLELARHLIGLIPESYRRDGPGEPLHSEPFAPSAEEVFAVDPSESVRSDEILPLVAERFEILERRDLGGTLLHLVLEKIVRRFNPQNPVDVAWLNRLFDAEDALLAAGEITSDFAVVLARRR
ncbi:MAG: methyltransferase domain-containing protein [Thermoanaerobaculia bacterium]